MIPVDLDELTVTALVVAFTLYHWGLSGLLLIIIKKFRALLGGRP